MLFLLLLLYNGPPQMNTIRLGERYFSGDLLHVMPFFYMRSKYNCRLAQLVEHRTNVREVAGQTNTQGL